MAGVRAPRPADDRKSDEDTADSVDVPAAVVCALCGRGDCAGCAKERTSSGVIAIIPWERPQIPWPARFFATVQATTSGAESFFRTLPDGPVSTAFGFAVLAEIFAVASTAAIIAPLVVLGIPGLLLRFLSSGPTRDAVLLATLVGVVGFTTLLVGAHALYALALGRAISRARALRLGFYACGWDFGSSPAGLVAATYAAGARASLFLLGSSITAPPRAIDAALAGIYRLDGAAAHRAKRRAMRIAMSCCVPAVVLVMTLVAATAFLGR